MTSTQQTRVRPSISTHSSHRRVSERFSVEDGQEGARAAGAAAERNFEEMEELRRYEDFTTIDWVQDAAREQLRRRAKRKANAGPYRRRGRWGVRQKIWQMYGAGQAWIVVTLVGAAIGLNAAFLNIATEWLSDIKRGHCTTAFYLNEKFCCWGTTECDEWQKWTGFFPTDYLIYSIFGILFAFTAARLVRAFAPYAAGSGISEIKCIIAGFVMKDFLGFWTLLIKSIALPLAIGSGLSVGKEGPSVHYAVCTGNVISRYFKKYQRNASKTREILSACAAAGVAVAFGSPIGGVLFSLEEMSSYFPLKTLWRSYFCCLVATAVLAAMNPFRTGQLVMFQVHYDRSWHFFEVPFFMLLGIFGGLYGAFVIKWNLWIQAFRKKYLSQHAVLEAMVLAAFTALLCFPNMFLRIEMTEEMAILFHECEGPEQHKVCHKDVRGEVVASLVYATVIRLFLVIISYGCKVPAGIFVPSMAIGASFGRVVGIVVQVLHETHPRSAFFGACSRDGECITPGTFALLGAAAALSGIMHITVSVVVIMFELTGALTYILPTMIVVGTTKAVTAYFPAGGIADRMIWFNGFPFLDTKEEHAFHVPVAKAMTPASALTILPATGGTLGSLERVLASSKFSGFPIVSDHEQRTLLGYIGRTELAFALSKASSESHATPDAKVTFIGPAPSSSTPTPVSARSSASWQRQRQRPQQHDFIPEPPTPLTPSALMPHITFDTRSAAPLVDLSRFTDVSPLAVSPRLPLDTALELFKKMGPRAVLVEHRGRLDGLVTIKDVLRFQFANEARERSPGDEARAERSLWAALRAAALGVASVVRSASGGRIRLAEVDTRAAASDRTRDWAQARSPGMDEAGALMGSGEGSAEAGAAGPAERQGDGLELEER